MIDRYNWQDHQLYHQSQEQILEHLSLRDVLDVQLGQGKDANGKDIWKVGKPETRNDDGFLFEMAIARALDDQKYEVLCGIHDSKNQVDIDVMIRHQNQVGIIEAKTGSKANGLEGVKQLSTAMGYLKGTYIKKFLVINDKAKDDQKTVCELLNIEIVPLTHYQTKMNDLTQEDTAILLTAIDKIMKV